MRYLDLDFCTDYSAPPVAGYHPARLRHGRTVAGVGGRRTGTRANHATQAAAGTSQPATKAQAAGQPRRRPAGLAAAFGLRRQWRTDWDGLYQALEQAQFKGIALLQIQPDARRSQLKLVGEALSEADLHDYLRRLQQTGRLREAVLAQSIVDDKQPHQPIRFQLQAEWVQR